MIPSFFTQQRPIFRAGAAGAVFRDTLKGTVWSTYSERQLHISSLLLTGPVFVEYPMSCSVCWLSGRVQHTELEISASERIFSANAACRYAMFNFPWMEIFLYTSKTP